MSCDQLSREYGPTAPVCADYARNTCHLNVTAPAASAASDDPAVVRATRAIEKCENESEDAEQSCMTDPNDGTSGLMGSADQLARGMGSAAGTACGQVADYANAANSALAGIKVNCSSGASSCSSACGEAATAIRALPTERQAAFRTRMTEARTICSRAQTRLQGIQQQIAQVGQSIQNSNNCQNDVTNGADNQTLLQKCQANPSLTGCAAILAAQAQDCSNPAFATSNVTCICQSNPSDSRCGYARNAVGTGGGLGGGSPSSGDGAAGGKTSGSAFDPGSMADSQLGNPGGPGSPLSAVAPLGGGGGGGMGNSGGGQNGAGSKKPGAPGSRYNTNLISGYRGGGGVAGFGAAGSAAGGAGSGQPRGTASAAGLPGKVDLSRFLPGARGEVRMGNNGISGPDGITGPFSDNWKKMNNRYEAVRNTLQP